MIHYSKIIDISLPLHPQTVVYPGNPSIEIEEIKSASGQSVISKLTLGSHTGTHIDAPKHCLEKGHSLDQIELTTFIGECRVLDCTHDMSAVSLKTLKEKKIRTNERILLKTTNSQRGFTRFYDDYVYLSPEGARHLADKNVKLVGIDYLSIKQRGSKDNSPHTLLLSKNIPILEGIDLSYVAEGTYNLICLPLKFMNTDGSPVRAILLP